MIRDGEPEPGSEAVLHDVSPEEVFGAIDDM
jgi:hypothetical protein